MPEPQPGSNRVGAVEAGTTRIVDLTGQRWIFVEDSEFLPAHGGGEREHLAMLQAAGEAGLLAAVVLPVSGPIDTSRYGRELAGVPIITVQRRLSPLRLLHPRHPYTVASRVPEPGLLARVRAEAPDATGVVVTSYKSWRIGEVLARGLGLPAVLRMHNREGAYHRSLAEGTGGPRGVALRWEASRIERDERRLAQADWLSGVADISAADARWRRTLGPVPVVQVPPFAGPDLAGVDRDPAEPPEVLFVGALDVATNVDAVKWLLSRVWPRVHAARPDAHLLVVGRAPVTEVRQAVAAAEGVQLHADVPAVQPFLARAAVAVNPAVSGSGVNIKLVEYLAAAVPVVTTSHATAGLGDIPGTVVVDQPQEFADAVLDLLADPERAARMGVQAAGEIRRMLDPRAGLAKTAELLAQRR